MCAVAIANNPAGGVGRGIVDGGRQRGPERGQRGVGRGAVERPREVRRGQPAEREIDVGDGDRGAAVAVADRPGLRAGAGGADGQGQPNPARDRAAAGGDGVDVEGRRAQPQTGHRDVGDRRRLVDHRADVGRRAAHVERDARAEPAAPRDGAGGDHAAGGTRQHQRAAARAIGRHQLAARGHHLDRRHRQRGGERGQLGGDDRGEVGVDHRGLGAGQEARRGRDLVAARHVGEAGGARDRGDRVLERRRGVAVHHDHREAAAAGRHQRRQPRRQRRRSVDGERRAGGVGAGLDLDRRQRQRRRPDDVEREQRRAGLIADRQEVGEAAGDRQRGRRAAALEQRVGRDGGAQAQRVRWRRRPQHRVDRRDDRVARRGHLGGAQLAGRGVHRDRVGERAAAIDPHRPRRRRRAHPNSIRAHERGRAAGSSTSATKPAAPT
jgi:hypothetical protein